MSNHGQQGRYEKVVNALALCQFAPDPCFNRSCPYHNREEHGDCILALHKDALALVKTLASFKEYFDGLYGEGLYVANWHLNGELEPFDNFYDSAMEANCNGG